jgi:uncharacterized protein YukE
MLLKVKHEELNNVTGVMVKDGEAYDTEIKNMLEQIDKLRTIWKGQDAEIFCDNVTNYITKMKNIPICLRNMSKFVNDVNNGYTEQDEAFGKELEVEANNYDEEPSSNN